MTALDAAPAIDDSAALCGLEENFWALWSRFGRGQGCTLHESADAAWFETPIAKLPYNTVIRFCARERIDQQIDEIFARYRSRNVPIAWIVHPSARPLDLGERLQQRGLAEVEVCPAMVRDLAVIPAHEHPGPGIEIEEVDETSELVEFLNLVAWRWALPDNEREHLRLIAEAFAIGQPGSAVRAWLARREGQPVSKVLLNLDKNVAGIYGVATRPEARGHGLARALLITALHAARDAGFREATLESTPMAHGLYRELGFRDLSTFRIFAAPGTPQL